MRTARYGGAWPPCTELNGGLACIHLCICGNQQLSTQHPNCRAYCQFSTLFDPCWHDITFCNLIDDPSTKRPTSTNEPRQPTKTNSGQQCASNRAANAFSRRGRRNIQGFFNIPNLCTEGNHNVIKFVTLEKKQKRTLHCQLDLWATFTASLTVPAPKMRRQNLSLPTLLKTFFRKLLNLNLGTSIDELEPDS